MSRTRILLVALVALLAAALFWLLLYPGMEADDSQRLELTAKPAGGGFVLQSLDGPVSLESLRGKVVVLYFGYTWCPDICPTSLALLSAAIDELSADELSRFQALFISVDPGRDTLERLAAYAAYFHPSILGVTGTQEELSRVARMYGAAYHIAQQDSAAGYLVDHTAELYVIDKRGRLVVALPHGTAPDKILAVLKERIAEDVD